MSAVTASTNSRVLVSRRMRARHVTDQIGRVLLAFVLTLTTAVYVIVPIQAALWLQKPFIGVLLETPRTVNGTFSPVGNPWAGWEAGIKVGDQIMALDGAAVADARAIYQILGEHAPGDTVRVSLRNDLGETRDVAIPLGVLPITDVLTLFVVPYLVGLAYLAIGLWVYRNRRNQDLGRVFLLFCCSLAFVLATTFDLWTTQTFTRFWTAAIPWAAGLLIGFALLFPAEAGSIAERPMLRWLPLIPSILLIGWAQTQVGLAHPSVAAAWKVAYWFAGFSIVLFIASLLIRAIFAPSPTVREQSRVVLVGSIIAFIPFLAWVINSNLITIVPVLASFVFFPLVIAYSIVQYSVLDTGRAVSFATTYVIVGIVVVAGYALIVAGVTFLSAAALEDVASNPVLIALLAFGLVIAFQPARERLQTIIDSFFFRSRQVHQERLTAFRHDLTLASGLGEVVRLLKQQLRETLMPTHTYVFLRDAQTNMFVAAGEGARPDTDIRFEAQSGLVHALTTTRDVIFLEPNRPLPPELLDNHAQLAVLRTPLMSPLQGQDRLAGWVAIGPRRSGERFSIEDIRFVQALTEQASLAVERAQVIGDLERRVRELDVLSQVSQAVNFTTDPEVLLELIYTQTSKLIDTSSFYIIIHDAAVQTLAYEFFLENDERNESREGRPWPDTEGLEAEVVRTGRPIRTADYLSECERLNVTPLASQPYAWMGVPLNAGTQTLGAMIVASYSKDMQFTEDQLKIFWAIADQAATALDKARLFNETETRARQLATLNEINKQLSSTLDMENLLNRIMNSAVEIIGTDAGTLFMLDENSQDLVFRVVVGGAANLIGTRIPGGVGVVGEAAVSGRPVIVNNVLHDGRWFSDMDRETELQTQSLLAVPLSSQDQTLGVLEVINKKDGSPFDDGDISLLTTFAGQASVVIQNARLYEATDAELTARVDELQNLQRIDRELNRTLRLDRVIQITLDWALRTTGASAGAILMVDNEHTVARILAANGYRDDVIAQGELPLASGIVGRVLRTARPEFVRDVKTDPDFVSFADVEPEVQMVVPLLRANQPIGVLVLESHIPSLLDDGDFEFIQRLVEHAAVAIENARLLQEVEDANRSKTEFISFVAHELKNPMTSIRGYTDLLKGGQVGEMNDVQGQFLGTIRSNVDRMTHLVSDLADVARIESGQLRLERSPISVRGVVDETLRGLEAQIQEKNQELIVELNSDLPPILADHTRMVQVLTNLVSNAHKYTPDGGKIWVGAQVEDIAGEDGTVIPMARHWVRDTGIGLAPDELEQLFTKFFRTQRGKDMAQGTGLGLNITKNLIERHDGVIWIESEVGQGTTFYYAIPLAQGEAVKLADQ